MRVNNWNAKFRLLRLASGYCFKRSLKFELSAVTSGVGIALLASLLASDAVQAEG